MINQNPSYSSSEKSLTKFYWRERKNVHRKGMIRGGGRFFFAQKQLSIPKHCIKFLNPSCDGSCEIFERNLIGEKERMKNKGN